MTGKAVSSNSRWRGLFCRVTGAATLQQFTVEDGEVHGRIEWGSLDTPVFASAGPMPARPRLDPMS